MEDLVTDIIEENPTHNNKTLKELNKELDQAVANEDYELAAKLRDEISKREKNN